MCLPMMTFPLQKRKKGVHLKMAVCSSSSSSRGLTTLSTQKGHVSVNQVWVVFFVLFVFHVKRTTTYIVNRFKIFFSFIYVHLLFKIVDIYIL